MAGVGVRLRRGKAGALLGAFVILLVFGSVLFPPAQEAWLFAAYTAVLCLGSPVPD
jgi:hypothetical protein